MVTVNILGTEYKVIREPFKDKDSDGYCDYTSREIKIRDEFIKLGQLLKLADMVQDGVEAKYVITDGLVKVNGEVDDRRGRKVYEGDIVSYDGKEIKVIR